MSNITTTINIDDPVGGHQGSQRLIGLATKKVRTVQDKQTPVYVRNTMADVLVMLGAKATAVMALK